MTSNRDKSPSTRLRYFVAGPPERQAVFSHTGCSRWPPLFSRPPGNLAVKPIQQVVWDAIVPSKQFETLKRDGVYHEDTFPAWPASYNPGLRGHQNWRAPWRVDVAAQIGRRRRGPNEQGDDTIERSCPKSFDADGITGSRRQAWTAA